MTGILPSPLTLTNSFTETFRPIAVRLDCQWHEKRVNSTTKPTTNTFSVPDEEDDVVEVVNYKKASNQQKSSPWSDSSDMEYGSDMSRPLDLTSPVTSPEFKVSQLPAKPLNDATVATTIQQTTLTTSEAVVPPSSPPYHAASPEISDDINHSESDEVEEDDGSEVEESAGEEQGGIFDEDSEDSEDDHYEGSDWGEEAQAPAFSVFQGGVTRPAGGFKADEVESSAHDENGAFSQMPDQPILTNHASVPAMATQVEPLTSTESIQQGFTWPEYFIPRVPSPSDKAMAKPIDIPAPAAAPCLTSTYQPYSNIAPAIQAWASRNQGSTTSFASHDANESFPFGPHRSSGGYLRHAANDISGGYSLKTHFLADEEPQAVEKSDKPVHAPANRVSVPDIVETYAQNHTSTSNKLKRKANEMEADSNDNSQEIGNTQDSITDAQPRPDLPDFQLTQSQVPGTQLIKEVALVSNEEHRRKRVKSSQAYTFMKYAAVAAVGAAVGSIGTIAGLSSLPADFFG